MKLGNVKVQSFSQNTPADLANAIRLWIENNAKEKTFVNLLYSFSGSAYTALLIYAE